MQPKEYTEFNRFLDRLDDYLYERGFYVNGRYIKKCTSYEEVEKYLISRCYNVEDSKSLIKKLREEIQLVLKTEESNQK